MNCYLRRIVVRLSETDVLTHMLPYQARFVARRG